jgi:hypothetical protein
VDAARYLPGVDAAVEGDDLVAGTFQGIIAGRHAMEPVGLDRIMAVAGSANIGSWRVMEKAGMRYQRLVNYYGLEGLKKYVAERSWWSPPPGS